MSLCEHLQKEKNECVVSRKLLDSAINIGLLVEEGKQAKTAPTFFKSIPSPTKKPSSLTFCFAYLEIKRI